MVGMASRKKTLKEKRKDRTMSGTEKQITWAKDIKLQFAAAFDALSANVPTTHKATFEACRNAIMGIEHAAFWIENRDSSTPAGIDGLCRKLVSGTLKCKGSEYSDTLSL